MTVNNENKDVHTEHCCVKHGCKYGDGIECSVESGQKTQSFRCESCIMLTRYAVLYTENHRERQTTFLGVYDTEEGADFAIETHLTSEQLRLPHANVTQGDYQVFEGEINSRWWS